MIHVNDTAKNVCDALSLSVMVAAVVSWLPPIAALLTIVWTLVRLYDRWKHGPRGNRP